MGTGGHPDGATVDTAVATLLARHRGAALCAIGPDGVFVTMPDSVPVEGHQVVVARSALDVVVPADRVAVISAWERARATGAARASVRLVDNPDRIVALHFLNAEQRHGVYLGIFVPTDLAAGDDEGRLFGGDATPVPPRFARARKGEAAVFLDVDEATTQILGWRADEMVGRRSLEFVHPEDHEIAIDNWMEMLASPGPVRRVRLRHRHRDGSWVWMEITNQNMLEDPEYRCVVAEMMDISDEMAAHEALRAREQLLDRLADALPVGVVQVDADRRVLYTNSRLHVILGTPWAATLDHQLITVLADDRAALADAFDETLGSRRDSDIEVRLRPAGDDGTEVRRCAFSLRALTADTGEVTGAIVCVADVTESARLRDELRLRATFDDVTRCHNRASTMAALETLLADDAATGPPAVIFVDLDRFKEVNDRFGHAAGDELLGVVARRLLRSVRTEDIVGRIGGDEFLVIRPGITSAAQALRTARRLAETFGHPVRLKGARVACRASVGVAWSPDAGVDAEGLVAMADAAMYVAKRAGGDDPVFATGPPAAPGAPATR